MIFNLSSICVLGSGVFLAMERGLFEEEGFVAFPKDGHELNLLWQLVPQLDSGCFVPSSQMLHPGIFLCLVPEERSCCGGSLSEV